MLIRLSCACGVLAFVTFNVGWIAGGLAQPDRFSSADDDISDLGALTASSAWLYNQIAANLTGLLVVGFALGVWRVTTPDLFGRLGAAALVAAGVGTFLDGIFRLDCQGIDAACKNDSWHSSAHKIESGVTAAAVLLAPLLLALAFRRIPAWRDSWLPTLCAVPAVFASKRDLLGLGRWRRHPCRERGRLPLDRLRWHPAGPKERSIIGQWFLRPSSSRRRRGSSPSAPAGSF